jgi:hypothetical protein
MIIVNIPGAFYEVRWQRESGSWDWNILGKYYGTDI